MSRVPGPSVGRGSPTITSQTRIVPRACSSGGRDLLEPGPQARHVLVDLRVRGVVGVPARRLGHQARELLVAYPQLLHHERAVLAQRTFLVAGLRELGKRLLAGDLAGAH